MIFNIIECLGDLGFGNRGSVITNAYRQCKAFHNMIDNHQNGECEPIRLKDWDYKNPLIEVREKQVFVTFSNKCERVGKQWKQRIEVEIHGVEFMCDSQFLKAVLYDIQRPCELEYERLVALCNDYGIYATKFLGSSRFHSIGFFEEKVSKTDIRKSNISYQMPRIIRPYFRFRVSY